MLIGAHDGAVDHPIFIVGVGSQILNSLIGVSLGLTAGYWGGWWDDIVTGLTNLLLAIYVLKSHDWAFW